MKPSTPLLLLQSLQQFLSGTRKKGSPSSKAPIFLQFRSSTTLIVITACLGIFVDIFFYALIIPVIPFALNTRLSIPTSKSQTWTSVLLACYAVALLIGSPLMGLYADHTSSRRFPLLIGLLALAGSTFLLCFGREISLFVVGRLLQGFSSAVVWSVGCALLVDTMGEEKTGVAMGYCGIAMSLGLVVAPAAGGAVYEALGYLPVFYLAFGVVAVDILLRLVLVEKKVARQWVGEEQGREMAELSVPARTSSTTGKKEGKDDAAQLTPAAVPSPGSIPDEETVPLPPSRPMPSIPPSPPKSKLHGIKVVLTSTRLLAALYGIVVESTILMAFDATIPLFLQRTFHWTSLQAGLLLMAVFIPMAIASPIAGLVSDRRGAKYPSLFGFAATVPVLACLRFVDGGNTLTHKIVLAVLMALLGVTLSFANTPLMAEVGYAIEDMDRPDPETGERLFGGKGAYGLGYGLFNMAFALGGVIGPIWGGYVVEKSWAAMTLSFAMFALTAVFTDFWLVGGRPQFTLGRRRRREESSSSSSKVPPPPVRDEEGGGTSGS